MPDGLFAERSGPGDVLLRSRLRDALARINGDLPAAAIEEALRKLASLDGVLLVDRNHEFHYFLVNGIAVEYAKADGSIGYTNVRVIDAEKIENNDWLAVNQFSVVEGHHHRRPDIMIFVNGEKRLREYQNRALTTAEIIERLIDLAKEMNEASRRGDQLGLTEDELAFYDALETNDSAVAVLGNETLRNIARELVETVKKNVTIDWTVRESVQANLRRLVKRILKKYGYPPDRQQKATETVLEQAALYAEEWAA